MLTVSTAWETGIYGIFLTLVRNWCVLAMTEAADCPLGPYSWVITLPPELGLYLPQLPRLFLAGVWASSWALTQFCHGEPACPPLVSSQLWGSESSLTHVCLLTPNPSLRSDRFVSTTAPLPLGVEAASTFHFLGMSNWEWTDYSSEEKGTVISNVRRSLLLGVVHIKLSYGFFP